MAIGQPLATWGDDLDAPSRLIYDFSFWLSGTALTLGFSLRTFGMRNVPVHGPALLVANHQSFLDPLIVGLAARRRLRFLARKTLFRHRAFAWYIQRVNASPIDQEGIGIEGLRVVVALLKAGEAVLVFPEGERTGDGRLHAFRPGVHLLLKRCPVPVIPVGIAGAYDAWPRWRKWPRPSPLFMPAGPSTIAVSIGPPLQGAPLVALGRSLAVDTLEDAVRARCARAERLRRKG